MSMERSLNVYKLVFFTVNITVSSIHVCREIQYSRYRYKRRLFYNCASYPCELRYANLVASCHSTDAYISFIT